MLKRFLTSICLLILLGQGAMAQQDSSLVQLSGLVIGGDSLWPVAYTRIVVYPSGRGAMSDEWGYFSFALKRGDSVVFSSYGYNPEGYRVPDTSDGDINILVQLLTDSAHTPVIEIFPYYTESQFKQAFLAMRLPEDPNLLARNNLNPNVMRRLNARFAMDGSMNHTYFQQQYVRGIENRYIIPTNPLYNPFVWYQIIKSIKNGDLKKKE